MGAYYLSYNEITIPLTRVSMHEESEMSEDGVDLLYKHTTLKVQGVVHRSYTGTDNAAYMRTLRSSFSEPRGYLNYWMVDSIAGQSIIISTPPGGDAKTGPIVSSLDIMDAQGDSLIISATIETWTVPCAANVPVRSVRWEQEVRIDQNGLSRITTNGLVVVTRGINPDSVRSTILPVKNIPAGFQREELTFRQSRDATKLMFTVVDQEVKRPPVDGITDWEADWDEESSLDNGGGVIVIGTLTARASAPKNVGMNQIVQFLAKIVASRINFTPDANGHKDLMLNYKIRERLHTNECFLAVAVQIVSQQNVAGAPTTTRIGTIVEPLDTSSNKTVIGDRGTALATLYSAVIAPTCTDKTAGSTPNQNNSETAQHYNTEVEIVNDITETSGNYISDEQATSPYIRYEIQTLYHDNYHVVQLPKASGTTGGVTSAACVLSSAPTSTVTVRYHIERLGTKPNAPNLNLGNNYFLMHAKYEPQEPRMLPDGNTVAYACTGEMLYGMYQPAYIGFNQLSVPVSPIPKSNTPGLDHTVASTDFQHQIFQG